MLLVEAKLVSTPLKEGGDFMSKKDLLIFSLIIIITLLIIFD